jgi:hypothetical protein
MSNHTPGPWRELYTRVDDASGYQIAHLDLHGKSEGERDANRRLIAAAPDLLKALRALVLADQEQGLDDTLFDAARAAIAKATGEQ